MYLKVKHTNHPYKRDYYDETFENVWYLPIYNKYEHGDVDGILLPWKLPTKNAKVQGMVVRLMIENIDTPHSELWRVHEEIRDGREIYIFSFTEETRGDQDDNGIYHYRYRDWPSSC